MQMQKPEKEVPSNEDLRSFVRGTEFHPIPYGIFSPPVIGFLSLAND